MKKEATKKCGVFGKVKKISEFWTRSDNNKPRNTCKDCQKKQATVNKK